MSKVQSIDGKPVVDAKRKIILRVQPGDIEAAMSKAPDACAAAMACVRQLFAMSARVHLSRTFLEYKDEWVRYVTPMSLRTEIVSFDRGHKFQTGSYLLRPVTEGQKGSHKPKGKTKAAKAAAKAAAPRKRSVPRHKVADVRDIANYHEKVK